MTLTAKRFQSARTEDDWFNLLGSVLEGLPQIYIIMDLEVLGKRTDDQYPIPNAFARLVDQLEQRQVRTVVKIALISYRPLELSELPSVFDKVITIPKKGKPGASRRAKGRGGAKRHAQMSLYASHEDD